MSATLDLRRTRVRASGGGRPGQGRSRRVGPAGFGDWRRRSRSGHDAGDGRPDRRHRWLPRREHPVAPGRRGLVRDEHRRRFDRAAAGFPADGHGRTGGRCRPDRFPAVGRDVRQRPGPAAVDQQGRGGPQDDDGCVGAGRRGAGNRCGAGRRGGCRSGGSRRGRAGGGRKHQGPAGQVRQGPQPGRTEYRLSGPGRHVAGPAVRRFRRGSGRARSVRRRREPRLVRTACQPEQPHAATRAGP